MAAPVCPACAHGHPDAACRRPILGAGKVSIACELISREFARIRMDGHLWEGPRGASRIRGALQPVFPVRMAPPRDIAEQLRQTPRAFQHALGDWLTGQTRLPEDHATPLSLAARCSAAEKPPLARPTPNSRGGEPQGDEWLVVMPANRTAARSCRRVRLRPQVGRYLNAIVRATASARHGPAQPVATCTGAAPETRNTGPAAARGAGRR